MAITKGSYVRFVFDDADVPPMLVTYTSGAHVNLLGRDWQAMPFDLQGIEPQWLVAAPSPIDPSTAVGDNRPTPPPAPPVKAVGDPMHGPDGHGGGFQGHDQGRPDFGGDNHFHGDNHFYGYQQPFSPLVPIMGIALLTGPRMVPNPIQGNVPQLMSPGQWVPVNAGTPAATYTWQPLAAWPL